MWVLSLYGVSLFLQGKFLKALLHQVLSIRALQPVLKSFRLWVGALQKRTFSYLLLVETLLDIGILPFLINNSNKSELTCLSQCFYYQTLIWRGNGVFQCPFRGCSWSLTL